MLDLYSAIGKIPCSDLVVKSRGKEYKTSRERNF